EPFERAHDGTPARIEIDLLQVLQGRAAVDFEDRRELLVGDYRNDDRLAVVDGVAAISEETIEGAAEGLPILGEVDDVGRQAVDGIDGRLAVGGAHATDLDELGAG